MRHKLTLFLFFLLFLLNFSPCAGFAYQLGICAIFQNEARFLKEWIEFHRLVGVEHFYLYNNRSTDDYLTVIRPYLEEGVVDLIEWPYAPTESLDWNAIQSQAYMHAVGLAKGNCNWLAIIDLDEFIVPVKHNTIQAFLEQYDVLPTPSVGAICVNWQLYGTSGVVKVPEDKLSIEMLLMKAPEDYHENLHVKSIVHPHAVRKCHNPHYVGLRKGYRQINPDFVEFQGAISPYVSTDQIRINHYWTRDEEYLFTQKMQRRNGWHEGGASVEARAKALNAIEDPIMLRFVAKLRKKSEMR